MTLPDASRPDTGAKAPDAGVPGPSVPDAGAPSPAIPSPAVPSPAVPDADVPPAGAVHVAPVAVAPGLEPGTAAGPGDGPQRLHPNIRKAWVLSSLIMSVIIVGGIGFADLAWLSRKVDAYPLPGGVLTGAVGLLMAWITFGMPRLWYRHWSYDVREHDVLICQGVMWQSHKSVPRLRIQHVDVERDPLDRLFGLASVTLYTAGGSGGDAAIPGLTPEVAEHLREELLIRAEHGAAGTPNASANANASAHLDAVIPPDESFDGAP